MNGKPPEQFKVLKDLVDWMHQVAAQEAAANLLAPDDREVRPPQATDQVFMNHRGGHVITGLVNELPPGCDCGGEKCTYPGSFYCLKTP